MNDLLMGKRVLVLEDEMMVAMLIEDALAEQASIVIGPARTVAEALLAIQHETIDVAVLDVNINGELSYAVADELDRRDIPFVFATGYGAAGVHAPHERRFTLQKPFRERDLIAALERALTRAG